METSTMLFQFLCSVATVGCLLVTTRLAIFMASFLKTLVPVPANRPQQRDLAEWDFLD